MSVWTLFALHEGTLQVMFALPSCLPYSVECPTIYYLPYSTFTLLIFRGKIDGYKYCNLWFTLFMKCPTSYGLPSLIIYPTVHLPYWFFGEKSMVINIAIYDLPHLWNALRVMVCPHLLFTLHEVALLVVTNGIMYELPYLWNTWLNLRIGSYKYYVF